VEEIDTPDYDLFHPLPSSPDRQGPQTRAARKKQMEVNNPQNALNDMEVDTAPLTGPSAQSGTQAQQAYSPSHPQSGAAVVPVP
jgi:hypothetical protein